MKHQDIIKLQEHIMGVSILVGMVRNSLVPVDDHGSGEIDDAIAALKTIAPYLLICSTSATYSIKKYRELLPHPI